MVLFEPINELRYLSGVRTVMSLLYMHEQLPSAFVRAMNALVRLCLRLVLSEHL